MLLGFISLLLTVGQDHIAKICIPAKFGNIMLPCSRGNDEGQEEEDDDHSRRRLLSHVDDEVPWRRVLAGATTDHCSQHVSKILK